MQRLSGKEVSEARRQKLHEKINEFKSATGVTPGLTVVLVGDDPASEVYVRNKHKSCEKLGMNSWVEKLPADTSEEDLKKLILGLNENLEVHGILVQLPLPKHLNEDKVLSWIDPRKDPDGLTTENMGLLWTGKPRVAPCTPSGVMAILEHYNISVAGKNAVVVGRSNIVGKPMAYLLQAANATVTVCHSKTPNTSEICQQADIVVVAAGQPRFMGKDDFKKASVVIDVGIHRTEDGLCGDVRFDELEGHCSAATPVPGGVGPMTITMLLENTFQLAKAQSN